MKGEIEEGKKGEKKQRKTERGRRERVKRGGHTSGITTTS